MFNPIDFSALNMTHAAQLSFFDLFDAEMAPSLVTPVAAAAQIALAANDPLASVEAVGGSLVLPGDEDVEAQFQSVYNLSTEDKVARSKAAIHRVFDDGHPIVLAYSAGKDSTVMLYLALEVAVERKAQDLPMNQILITHASTLVDNPAYEEVTRHEIAKIRAFITEHDLPARLDIASPSLNDTWAVRIISGRALPTFANSSSRDCSISLKIQPQQRQRKAALKELSVSGAPVVMVGTRFDESASRNARMKLRGETDDKVWLEEVRSPVGKKIRDELRLSPICFYSQEDIWVILSELQSGELQSYTDAASIWEAYRDGGNTSCAVVSDDVMKASAKACGARFGCWSCAAVGRDKSLESMIESDEKYAFMRGLNRLQRFIVDTQYDMARRQWVGRTVTKDGYIAIAPDAYSPKMQRDLLLYALTLDKKERQAARELGIEPRFEIVTLQQLIAIDIIWSMQGHQPRAFEAVHLWMDVNEKGSDYFPPEVGQIAAADKKVPKPVWLNVGRDYDSDAGYSSFYTGARNIMADLVGATETGGCQQNIELGDGRVVMGVDKSDFFEVDAQGAEDFFFWEVIESRVHERKGDLDSGEAFRHYQMLGTFSTARRHLGEQDYMLRRAEWKRRHGVYQMTREQLLSASVSDAQRAAGLRAPEGVKSLPERYQERLDAEHARRTAGAWRPGAPQVDMEAIRRGELKTRYLPADSAVAA
ncbi:phosphoadenosine phosphosulfate reductase domain-containing protein [Paucibacter soli]|uniref:phosphoadenosine phosphosulfate reductase domain-containing protein n=1 Tax=Paucibacter soli TaxID=3133433 RepID=UPI0030B06095